MQFVKDDRVEIGEQIRRVGVADQQRDLLGRRQQNVRRVRALTRFARRRRIAATGFSADFQTHLGDRRIEIARNVGGKRLERRNVERAQSRTLALAFAR